MRPNQETSKQTAQLVVMLAKACPNEPQGGVPQGGGLLYL